MPKRSEPKANHAPADECGQRISQHLARLGLAGLDVEAHLTWAREHHATDCEAVERLFAQAVSIKRERSIERPQAGAPGPPTAAVAQATRPGGREARPTRRHASRLRPGGAPPRATRASAWAEYEPW